MKHPGLRPAWLLLALLALAALLPGLGQSKLPPESDSSSYTWSGAATMAVDVQPWGGGYVQSSPYLIDCPLACVRPWAQGREVMLKASPTPGYTFERWDGVCAGQRNPCTLTISGGLVEVTAVFGGHYTPPTPPAPPPGPPAPPPPSPPPPVEVNPQLVVENEAGVCPECFYTHLTGTGFHPNSSISLEIVYISPDAGTFGASNVETTDASGSWSQSFFENCEFDSGLHHGPVSFDITATDTEGAQASGHSEGTCP